MKKMLLLFSAFAFCGILSTHAQLKLGVEAGVNLTQFQCNEKGHASTPFGMGAGFQVAGTVDYEFRSHWVVASGLTFAWTQSDVELTCPSLGNATLWPKVNVRLNHLMLPVKVGYDFHIGKHVNLMPSVGLYAAYNFTVGKSTLQRLDYDADDSPAGFTQHQYDPMDGYSYSVPTHNPLYPAEISPFRRWEGGAMGGVKAIIKQHYTFSVDYYQSFSEVQSSNDLRSSGLMISVGCRF